MTNIALNFPAWTSSILLFLFQVWYQQPALCSLLRVLWCLHRAPIQTELSWQSHGPWGLPGVLSGRTHSVTKPGLNSAERLLHCGYQHNSIHFLGTMLWAGSTKREKMFILLSAENQPQPKASIQPLVNGKVRNSQPFKRLSSSSSFILLAVNYLWSADTRYSFTQM